MKSRLHTIAFVALMLGACSPAASGPTEAPADPLPAATCPPAVEPATPVCPTLAPATLSIPPSLSATIASGNLTLRSGPSTAHTVLGSYPAGTTVEVLGKAPGGGWVVVSAAEGRLGWMYTLYLDLEGALDDIVEVQPTESWTIAGRVVDDSGRPIESVPVVIELGVTGDIPIFTDAQGGFVLFAPSSQEGPWQVSVWGMGCQSRVVGNGCALDGFVLRNPSLEYSPGQGSMPEFVYEATALTLRGQVQDRSGAAIAATAVFGERLDGATTSGQTDPDGNFELPITPGTWSVWARGGGMQFVEVGEQGYDAFLTLTGVD